MIGKEIFVSSECRDPQMRRAAGGNGSPNRKQIFNTKNSIKAEQLSQSETAIAAAYRSALLRKAAS